jgi:hypothetical protein
MVFNSSKRSSSPICPACMEVPDENDDLEDKDIEW